MAGFLYFIESATAPNLDKLRELGLGYAFSTNPSARQTVGGPNGKNGHVFADAKRVDNVKFNADKQEWRKIPGKDVWVGYWRDSVPAPSDLAKPDPLPGFNIRMGDDHVWHIPAVRTWDEETEKCVTALPYYYDLDDDGNLIPGSTLKEWRWLWDATETAWQAVISDGDVSNQALLEVDEIFDPRVGTIRPRLRNYPETLSLFLPR